MKVMALDFGSRTCGVALSDELLITAQPLEIIRRERESMIRKTLGRIEELVRVHDVRLIILGLPLNMDDTMGERAQLSMAFGEKVRQRTGVPVIMSDERLTTVDADEMMERMGIMGRSRKEYVDMIAANIILQEYLENHRKEIMENYGKN